MAKANGPFFFAVLMIIISIWAMTKLITLTKGKPTLIAVHYAVMTFCVITLIGGFLVSWRASSWWFAAQDVPFGRYATILRIPDDISVWSDAAELYQKRVDSKDTRSHSIKLAILSKAPCQDAGRLIIQLHRAGMKQPDIFPIECNSLDSSWPDKTSFNFDVDIKSGNLVLISNSKSTKIATNPLLPLAFADEPEIQFTIQSNTQRNYAPVSSVDQVKALARTLQSEQAKPGEKVDAINQLGGAPLLASKMTSPGLNAGLSEPLYATLLDLQRHSDKQLATKARQLTARLPIAKDLAKLAKSSDARDMAMLKTIAASTSQQDRALFKDPGDFDAILNRGSKGTPASGETPPIPTYTREGDRFFIRASWDNKDEAMVGCVGKAFFELWGGTSLAQQVELARTVRTRMVFYTKAWAISMHDRLRQCQAKVAYVTGYTQ
ncbi:hypothetical protein FNU76_01605 [Chitinimonas arctica]|uniref:Uncharacterized protein n=1 Tax=Chitinimonas arctica TaxID=2594795 RepID=A0A516SAI1_9NEIS|nr:hypothetical protein [Chitinimonas arctica]QDQ25156.1 hypothetical protein FNU76_01605 [Chitinimonas arctica]